MAAQQRARVTANGIVNTEGHSSPHTYPGQKGPVSVSGNNQQAVTELTLEKDPMGRRCDTLEFTLGNTSPPLANMLRRLFIAEVPTVAFDRVLITKNDGVVMDEVLSHRLAMTPIRAPAAAMDYQTGNFNRDITQPSTAATGFTAGTDFDTLNPKLHVVFEMDFQAPANGPAVTPVYSGQLEWVPLPGQEEWEEKQLVNLVHKDILLAKLGRGQSIKLKAVAIKGLGMSHAKWSPVSACWYRMKNEISLTSQPTAAVAKQIVKTCPMKVFDIEDSGNLRVANAGKCTLCRECLNIEHTTEEPLLTAEGMDSGKVRTTVTPYVTLEKNHNIVEFSLESLGQYDSVADIVRVGLGLFAERCRELKESVTASEPQQAATSNRSKKRGINFRSWWRRNSVKTRQEQYRANPRAWHLAKIKRQKRRQQSAANSSLSKKHAKKEEKAGDKKKSAEGSTEKKEKKKEKEAKKASKK